MQSLIEDIVCSLESFKDQKKKEFNEASHPTSMRIIGLTAKEIRLVLKGAKEKTKEWAGNKKMDLALRLLKQNISECQTLAFEYINKDKELMQSLTEELIDAMNYNMDNWGSVDTYSIYIVGPAWRMGILSDEKIKNYLKSDDFWQRRIAVVATVALNLKSQGGRGDVKRTLDICKLVAEDYNDMVVKALSWALRELSKREKEEVQDFIERYEEVLHKRVLKEVNHKLVFGTKN